MAPSFELALATAVALCAFVFVCEASAEPGDSNYWVELKNLMTSEGEFQPAFSPDGTDFTIKVANPEVHSVMLTMELNFHKYRTEGLPSLWVDNQKKDFSPLEPIKLEVHTNGSIGQYDKVWAIKLADPKGPQGFPLRHETAHTYNVRIMQPADYERAVKLKSLKLLGTTGKEIAPTRAFSPSDGSVHFSVPEEETYVSLVPECQGVATSMEIDGTYVKSGDAHKIQMAHPHQDVDVQCNYDDADWTKTTKTRAYSIKFTQLKDLDYNSLSVTLTIEPRFGYCAMREFSDDAGPSRPGFVCRSEVQRPGFIVTYEDTHAEVFMADEENNRHRLQMGLPRDLEISQQRKNWQLKVDGGKIPIHFPVTVIWAASCNTWQCGHVLVTRPNILQSQAAQVRLCLAETCKKEDEAHCCVEAPMCSSYEGCPKTWKPDADKVFCTASPCPKADEDRCCGNVARCDSYDDKKCSRGSLLSPKAKDVSCAANPCEEDEDMDVCCEAVEKTEEGAGEDVKKKAEEEAKRKAEDAAKKALAVRKKFMKGVRRQSEKAIAFWKNVGCAAHPMDVCSGQTCFYDETCLWTPQRLGGLGCYAGGLDWRCRFCGFAQFTPCPWESVYNCFSGNCQNWADDHLTWCSDKYNFTCPSFEQLGSVDGDMQSLAGLASFTSLALVSDTVDAFEGSPPSSAGGGEAISHILRAIGATVCLGALSVVAFWVRRLLRGDASSHRKMILLPMEEPDSEEELE
mmetsp:Transcript_83969/g.271362  ORF Transcript_83969/g.271362 Transcript_83969/m.271362 type:complete len:740 (+) Transcript_83969:54-2273(+)|eukprot:CAMPEP_0203954660 /NCGR_PEP_ID=MMETSP0359-20131031/87577_1 /ASSEMBLY_ACC=CAM_ASM_000338 /TAXON_ID=268821 /ORGANISM="Scrippsiella Hangoei, Strain SHTV-5" /LENGTH=739 /DNA_ID=CAMNT_0050888195 /DNA_START=35 /DNA_END=2254 /DNA_ORIENTATION=+